MGDLSRTGVVGGVPQKSVHPTSGAADRLRIGDAPTMSTQLDELINSGASPEDIMRAAGQLPQPSQGAAALTVGQTAALWTPDPAVMQDDGRTMPGAREVSKKPAPDSGAPLEDVKGTPFEDTDLDALAAQSSPSAGALDNPRLNPNPPTRSGLGVGTRGEGRGT